MHIFAKETFYFTASSGYRNIGSDWTDYIYIHKRTVHVFKCTSHALVAHYKYISKDEQRNLVNWIIKSSVPITSTRPNFKQLQASRRYIKSTDSRRQSCLVHSLQTTYKTKYCIVREGRGLPHTIDLRGQS